MGLLDLEWMYGQPRARYALVSVVAALSCAGCELMDVSRGDLWPDAGGSVEGPCAEQECSAGTHCELVEVECVRAPCDPVPECVKLSDQDGSVGEGGEPARDGGNEPDDARVDDAPSDAGDDMDTGSTDSGRHDGIDSGPSERDAGERGAEDAGEPDSGTVSEGGGEGSCGPWDCPPGWSCEQTSWGPSCKLEQGGAPGCEVALCPEGTYCDDRSGQAYCLPLPSCETKPCQPGTHCELQKVTCVRAPCPPVPTCVPNGGGTRCGSVTCPQGQVCCNPSCSACVVPGEHCTQQACGWTQ